MPLAAFVPQDLALIVQDDEPPLAPAAIDRDRPAGIAGRLDRVFGGVGEGVVLPNDLPGPVEGLVLRQCRHADTLGPIGLRRFPATTARYEQRGEKQDEQ